MNEFDPMRIKTRAAPECLISERGMPSNEIGCNENVFWIHGERYLLGAVHFDRIIPNIKGVK